MDIEILCNTNDEQLFAHIQANSLRPLPWVKSEPAHDGHAVIVGGGPSIKKTIGAILKRQEHGQTVFALNGSAEWLYKQGIRPRYQVIVDAREHNKHFVRYPWAKELLLSSQCHPSLFDHGSPTLWHPVMDGIEDVVKDDREYALIGGGTTVGLSALALAYTLGYRQIHLYGYDSCHEDDKGHAYQQPQNDKEPDCKVTAYGKVFKASLAMARQAELFPEVCNNLIALGCTITIEGDGLIPWVMANLDKPMTEEEKYREMWKRPSYREVSPGELLVESMLEFIEPTRKIIDFGCGTGRAGLKFAARGFDVTLVDLVDNSRDEAAKALPFVLWDFSAGPGITGDFAYCTDVMEHIPPDRVDATIRNIMGACPKAFFQISTVPDRMGQLIGQELHLTVQPAEWWAVKFESLGFRVQWSQVDEISAMFYVLTT